MIRANSPILKPWIFEGTGMRPNILLLCKLMIALLYVHSIFKYMNDPYLPFISIFDVFRDYPGVFAYFQKIAFALASVLLILNIRVRLMAAISGIVVILIMVISKPEFKNHIFVCGCFLLLAGLTDKKSEPWLLYLQFSIIYLGASINKFFQLDWWSGQFMHYWMTADLNNSIYLTVSSWLPEMWTAKMLSWVSMFVEFTIGVLFLIKRKHFYAVFILLLFHTALYTLTDMRFGHFFEALVIALLVFMPWPKEEVSVYLRPKFSANSTKLLGALTLNSNIKFYTDHLASNNWLSLSYKGQKLLNFDALRYVLILSPGFYVGLFALDLVVRFFTN